MTTDKEKPNKLPRLCATKQQEVISFLKQGDKYETYLYLDLHPRYIQHIGTCDDSDIGHAIKTLSIANRKIKIITNTPCVWQGCNCGIL